MFTRLLSRSLAPASRRVVQAARAHAGRFCVTTRIVFIPVNWTSHRPLSTSTRIDSESPTVDSLDENRFLELAEETLSDIQTWLDGIEEMLEESDVSLSQGVLKIDLGEHGTWVLNRQVPNRQIWWSSPISGPRRYEFDSASGKWLSTRDKTELFERLQDEIAETTGISIFQ